MSEYFALLDNNYQEDAVSWLFTDPIEFVTCDHLKDADAMLEHIERSQNYAVGFISYEFAAHYELACKSDAGDGLPFLQFGIFAKREALENKDVEAFLQARFGEDAPMLTDIRSQTAAAQYQADIEAIKRELEAGNTYQVNYTFETRMRQGGCVYRLYEALRQAQPVPYGAFLNFPAGQTLSRSPELFFEKTGDTLRCKPMKGTEPRGRDTVQDHIYRSHLLASPKQRAENLMIVDLLRNDMSRIAEFGTVQVDALFDVESYQTVHQMTSTISAKVQNQSFRDILQALFPCGSVTGAPKTMTMNIINRLEPHARGIYCGAIGVHEPTGDMMFNVPIRTLHVNNYHGRFAIGGGVVYDSVDAKEYEEALLKGKFLFDLPAEYRLIDTHFYDAKSGPRHLDLHLSRLERSAQVLKFSLDKDGILSGLDALYQRCSQNSKIRLELSASGEFHLESAPIDEFAGEKRIRLSAHQTHSQDPIYQYKTTNRSLYNQEFKRARRDGFYEVVFANEQGHLTEGAIHNLVLRFGDDYVTPPLEAGVLPGIGREVFLRDHPRTKIEPLSLNALKEASEILLVSSVRGVVPVRYEGE